MCQNTRFVIIGSRKAGTVCLAFVLALLACPRPVAGGWATDMFEETKHDFGTIAAGAKAEFSFKFQNKYLYDVHVARVRSSCGCSSVKVTKNSLATYETGEVVASINSKRLRGRQSSTLTVIFDKPRYAEVQLKVSVYIRGDYVLQPSSIDFGEVESGSAPVRELTVTHYGNADWRLADILGSNPHVQCELGELVRSGSRVSYPIKTTLATGAPPGDLRHQLFLISNDEDAKKIPVMVDGRVRPLLSVAPASLYLGSLRPGQSVTKRLVVRASTPFHIERISADCDCFEFSFTPDTKKTLHLVPVKFTAGDKQAGIRRTLRIKTDLNEEEAEIVALAAIDEQAR